MEELEKIGTWIDRLTPLVGLIGVVLSWLTGFFQNKIIAQGRKRKFNRLWGLKNDSVCEVIMPVRYGRLQQQFLGQQEFTTTFSHQYVTLNECDTTAEIARMLPEHHIRVVRDIKDTRTENVKISLGGLLANDYTIRFFKGEMGVHFRHNLQRGSSAATLEQPELRYVREFLTLRGDRRAMYIGEGPDRFEYPYDKDGDCLVWVKVSNDDFGQKNHGTVHCLFSNGADAVTDAVKFISENYMEFYSRLKAKGHLDHHFILLRYTATHEFDMTSFCDVTDMMFYNNNPEQNEKNG